MGYLGKSSPTTVHNSFHHEIRRLLTTLSESSLNITEFDISERG